MPWKVLPYRGSYLPGTGGGRVLIVGAYPPASPRWRSWGGCTSLRIIQVPSIPVIRKGIDPTRLTKITARPNAGINSIDDFALDSKFFRILKQFEPFGPKNPNPKFVSENILINNYYNFFFSIFYLNIPVKMINVRFYSSNESFKITIFHP